MQASKPVLEQFAKRRREVVQMSQAEFAAFMASETEKWEKVVKASRHEGRISANHRGLLPDRGGAGAGSQRTGSAAPI